MNQDRYAVLRIRDFRLALGSRFFATLATQMQTVVVGWQVYQLTHDPLALGLIGLAEALPYMGLALWAGHVADHFEKRRVITASEAGMSVCALALAGLALLGQPPLWMIYAIIGLGGICRSFLWSASSSYVEMVVPTEIYAKAAAWNAGLWQTGAIAGPALGGFIYQRSNATWGYAAVALSVFIAFVMASRMERIHPLSAVERSPDSSPLLSGIRFVFSNEIILGALSLDMFAVLFGDAVGILPIFAVLLHVGVFGLGLLYASRSLGALAMSLYQAHHRGFKHTGTTLFYAVGVFGMSMIAFALSRNFLLSMFLLAAGGMADCVSVVIRASILQALTPDHLRGRVSSVNGLFISSSNEIGTFESGLAAKLLGAVPSVIVGGTLTLASVLVVAWKVPKLRKLRSVG